MEKDIIITPEVEEQSIEVIAEQGVFPKGIININSNGETNVTNYAIANVNVGMNLQNKNVSITQNGDIDIQADEGYEGLSNVSVSVNVPPAKYTPKYLRFQNYTGTDLLEETKQLDTSNMTTFENMFTSISNLQKVDFSEWDTSKVTSMVQMFYYSFRYSGYRMELDLSSFVSNVPINISNMFYGCQYIKSIDLSNITQINRCDYAFGDCQRLESLDISKLDFSNVNTSQSYNYSGMFTNCGSRLPSGQRTIVYVKDADAQNWVLTANNGRPSSWSTSNVVIKN